MSEPSSIAGDARRAPTMEDVARRAGVSRALVSLVMRDQPNVSEAKRRRVLTIADALGYRPNAMARSLASRRTHTIGVVLDDLANPFFAEIAGGIEDLASELGYRILLGAGGRAARRERSALSTLLEYRVDGLILVSPRLASAQIRAAAAEVPVVTVGRRLRAIESDVVVVDERRGVELVIEHLHGLGHSDITHLDGGAAPGGPERRREYMRAMERRGLGAQAMILPGDFTEDAGVRAAEILLAGPRLPTAVFAANDLIAVGLLGALARAGVRVPDDVSVVGFDDTSIAGLAQVSLTTVHQPSATMGRMALELLLDRAGQGHGPQIRLVEPRLVVRTTTGRPRPADG